MPLARFQKLDEVQKQRLLAAAASEFATHGFEAASFNRIIAASGSSKGAMYYYFADKADLYRTVVDQAVLQMVAAIGALGTFDDSASFWSAVEELFARALSVAVEAPELAVLARSIHRNEAGVLDALVVRSARYLEGVLRAGQSVGAVRVDVPLPLLTQAALGLLTALDRFFVEQWAELAPGDLSELATKALGLCRDLVSPKGKAHDEPD